MAEYRTDGEFFGVSSVEADQAERLVDETPEGAVLSGLTILLGAGILIAAVGACTGYALYGSADAYVTDQIAAFTPCATIRQFGAGEAYWHHGHVYECVSANLDPRHVLSSPVAQ